MTHYQIKYTFEDRKHTVKLYAYDEQDAIKVFYKRRSERCDIKEIKKIK